jgi:hypothetical protein
MKKEKELLSKSVQKRLKAQKVSKEIIEKYFKKPKRRQSKSYTTEDEIKFIKQIKGRKTIDKNLSRLDLLKTYKKSMELRTCWDKIDPEKVLKSLNKEIVKEDDKIFKETNKDLYKMLITKLASNRQPQRKIIRNKLNTNE